MATQQTRDNAAVLYGFLRLKTLFDTEFLADPRSNWKNPFYISVLTETFILMSDLMMGIKDTPQRISFIDDITPHKHYTDITGLINYIRNAICHADNDKRDVGTQIVTFGMSVGSGTISSVSGKTFVGKYDDDGLLQMGEHTIYIKHHIIRAWEELKIVYAAMPDYPQLKHILQ